MGSVGDGTRGASAYLLRALTENTHKTDNSVNSDFTIHIPDSALRDVYLLDITSEEGREASMRYLECELPQDAVRARATESVYTFRGPLSEQERVEVLLAAHSAINNALFQRHALQEGSAESDMEHFVVQMSFGAF